jgi:hypothetical protein
VAAHVLAQAEQLALGREEACRVKAAGRRERRLGLAQPFGERGQKLLPDAQFALHLRRLDGNRFERALAADPAG